MASRRKVPTSYAAIKKSRSALTGAVTKAWDKFSAMETSEPEEVLVIKAKEVERYLASISRTAEHFQQSMEDAQQFLPTDEDGEAIFLEEEEELLDTFEDHLEATKALGEQLLAYKATLTGVNQFKTDFASLQSSISLLPDHDHREAVYVLQTSLSALRQQWQSADLSETHPIKQELDTCMGSLMTVQSKAAGTTPVPVSPSTRSDPIVPSYRPLFNELPKIKVPTFNGDVLKWSSFWATFGPTIHDRKDLNPCQKLNYLKQAISDPSLQMLLQTPVETADTYPALVEELKARFERPKEIHRAVTKNLIHVAAAKHTRADLMLLHDTVKCGVANLKATENYSLDTVLASNTYNLLPTKVQMLWDQHTQDDPGVPSIDQLLKFMKLHSETLPAATPPSPSDKSPNPKKPFQKKDFQSFKPKVPVHATAPSPATTSSPSTPSFKWECSLCAPERHPFYLCPKWATYTVPQRVAHIRERRLCNNCLSPGHLAVNCKSTRSCRDCGQRHHTSIHQVQANVSVNHATSVGMSTGLLPTAQVIIVAPNGKELKARALLDEGSGLSIISSRMAQLLDLPLTPERLTLSVAQGEVTQPLKSSTSFILSSIFDKKVKIPCKAAVAPTVTCDLPPVPVKQGSDLAHIMGLPLADPDYHSPGRIDILLGSPLLPHLMAHHLGRSGGKDEMVARHTPFGWVLGGPAQPLDPSRSIPIHHQTPIIQDREPLTEDARLDYQLQRMWKEQEPDEAIPTQTEEDKQVEDHYQATTKYLPEAERYEVALPKTEAISQLGDSKTQAISRFLSNEASTTRRGINPQFQAGVSSYLELHHAEEVPEEDEPPHPHFYLPMHSVIKESSSTTKLRIVFDGSAVTSSGLSLNQALFVGPTIQSTLSNLLIRFRRYPIALNADIAKMYREIQLVPEDRDLHRFVWRENSASPLKDYRMCRVTFGVSASPFLAIRTLHQAADDHGERYPGAVKHVKESFYVDDFLGGANTAEEAIELHNQLLQVLQPANLHLRKWRSSSQEVLDAIPSDLRETNPVKTSTASNEKTQSKALGLKWDSHLDEMSPSIHHSDSYSSTKRGIVSDVSKTYDVLGWISPTILQMKILFQQFWQEGIGWNDQVSEEAAKLHQEWRNDLPNLTTKTLPRCYVHPKYAVKEITLHGFADASQAAYGAVIYCRTLYHDHPPTMSLVTAKTKVAKLKTSTIPRLELCAATLLAKLLSCIGDALNIQSSHWTAWSDSSTVLAWLDGHKRRHPVFIANRVAIILEITHPSTWHYVPTHENPADCASRGMMPSKLLNHQLWWEGPLWLHQEPYPLPHQPPRKALPDASLPCTMAHLTQSTAEDLSALPRPYPQIITVTAWLQRAISRMKKVPVAPGTNPKCLTGIERRKAEEWLILEAQRVLFAQDLHLLKQGKPATKSGKLRALNPFIKDGLLRVGGRLAHSQLAYSQQHPLIMDASHPLMVKLFHHLHKSMLHCGPSLLLCYTSTKFHVIGARKLSRKTCSSCITCRKRQPKPSNQVMADLPSPRVSPAPAFTHTGVDFAGPFTIKQGYIRKPKYLEAYVCVFVCLTYKALHLEVVSDLSSASFSAALHRFVSRRGCPHHMYSDNGSNFVGTKNELHRLYQYLRQNQTLEEIGRFLSDHHEITWHFNPPWTPHMGGLWEAAVKAMKRHLKRVVGPHILTHEELETVLCQVEACLNSRPLLPDTSHPQDGLQTLTAGHFLLFKQPTMFPTDPNLPARIDLLKKWELCQAMVKHFWKRWSSEYLNHLQARTKWQTEKPSLQKGDIVLVKPKNKYFVGQWPLGLITQAFPGADGCTRVVQLKTAGKETRRATTGLALLFRPDSPAASPSPGVCSDSKGLDAEQPQERVNNI